MWTSGSAIGVPRWQSDRSDLRPSILIRTALFLQVEGVVRQKKWAAKIRAKSFTKGGVTMTSTGWVRRDLDKEKIRELYVSQKKSGKEIADLFQTSPQTIRRCLRDLGTPRRSTREANLASWSKREYRPLNINKEQDQIIRGTLLGDAHLGVQASSVNPVFSVGHRTKDKEYTLWKYQRLVSTGMFRNPPFPRTKRREDSREFERWMIRSIQHPVLKDYHNSLYNGDGKKEITLKWLEPLGPLGVSVYYMDDGGLKGGVPYLYTYGFTLEEVHLLRYFLDLRWGVSMALVKVKYGKPKKDGVILRLEKYSLDRFKELIVPYIIPCMSRKIPT